MTDNTLPTDEPAVVTCGLPYANGQLHIGHLRTYVGGDVLARSLQTIGQQTAFVCGSDMHGTPIAIQAIEDGINPESYALDWHSQYQETFPKFNIDFDNYGHTHDETNRELTHGIVDQLEAEGYVYEKEIQVGWDPTEDQPLPDRYVEGTCPYCGEEARGDECDEGCGRHLEPGEIKDPVSTITGNPAEYQSRTHKFFEISELSDYLASFLDDLEGTSNAQNQPREWIEEGLQDWCITRDLDWGFDYPGDDELVLYVWVDAPIEYIASTKQYSERVGADTYDWEDTWKENGEIIHVIGRDIIQHHTIFWPAMLEVTGFNSPRAIVASGFMSLDGDAFSTSRNRAIWAEDYLDEGFDPDLLRYYLVTAGDFQNDIDFSWDRFAERVNTDLVGTLGNYIYRVLLFASRNFDTIPDVAVTTNVQEQIEASIDDYQTAIQHYSTREATQVALELAQFGNEYIQRKEPWNQAETAAAQTIRDCLQLVHAIAVLCYPVLPATAEQIWNQLGNDSAISGVTLSAATNAPNGSIDTPEELFDPIDPDHVEKLNQQLEDRVAAAPTADDECTNTTDTTPSEITDPVDLATVDAVDLRVGEIVTANPIAESDSHLHLRIDIEIDILDVVAAIGDVHDHDELEGSQVGVIANIKPKEFFGISSEGMILTVEDSKELLSAPTDQLPGAKII